jgi:energy-coupling factor transporter transmembrane protein EcfT
MGNNVTKTQAWQSAFRLLGMLLSRSALRSERIHLAMLSRGYGSLDTTPPPWQLSAHGWLLIGLACSLMILLTVADVLQIN